MLDYKELLYFFISLIFFLLLLNFAGFYDYSTIPANFSSSLLFLFGLFFYFNKNHNSSEKKSIFLIRLNLTNACFYGLIALASQCIQISYIDLSKHLSAVFLFMTIVYSISSRADVRLFIKIFAYFNQVYILITMCYYFYFKFIEGVFFSGICYTMFYPYYYAALVICLAPFSLYLYFTSEENNSIERVNFLILFLLCCLNVFLTSSRIAQITLCLSISALLYYFNRFIEFKPKIKFVAFIFFTALLAGGLFTTDAYSRIAKSFVSSENFDLHDENGRLNIYKGAFKTFLDYPLTGAGPALSSMFITKYRVSKLCITDCHNIVLNRLCETGIFYTVFSFLTLAVTIGFTVLYVLSNKAACGGASLKGAGAACAISLASIYLQGFSMPHSFLTSLIYLEYIIIALCVSVVKIARSERYIAQNQGGGDILFSFTKKNMRLSALFSALIVFNALISYFTGDSMVYFMQWFMNLSFLLISVIVFTAHHYGSLTGLFIKNAGPKCIIGALIITQLFFQWRIFESGILTKAGINHNMAGENKQALDCFEKSAARYPSMASYLFLSSLYYNAGKTDKAYAAAVFYNSKLPYEIFGLNNLAECLIKKGHLTEAAAVFEKLDHYSAKNYMSASHGAFLIKSGNIEAGLEKYSKAAVENPEFLSNKYFCSELLTDQALINRLCEKLTADSRTILKTKENFFSHYLNVLSDVYIALRTYGYECGNEKISGAKKYKSKFIKTYIESLTGVLPAIAHLLNNFNSYSEFNPVKTYMRSSQKYKNYRSYKINIDSSSNNYSAHFGLKHWFDFENALIDSNAIYEPALKIPIFIVIILEKIYPPKLVKKYISDYYSDFYDTKIR